MIWRSILFIATVLLSGISASWVNPVAAEDRIITGGNFEIGIKTDPFTDQTRCYLLFTFPLNIMAFGGPISIEIINDKDVVFLARHGAPNEHALLRVDKNPPIQLEYNSRQGDFVILKPNQGDEKILIKQMLAGRSFVWRYVVWPSGVVDDLEGDITTFRFVFNSAAKICRWNAFKDFHFAIPEVNVDSGSFAANPSLVITKLPQFDSRSRLCVLGIRNEYDDVAGVFGTEGDVFGHGAYFEKRIEITIFDSAFQSVFHDAFNVEEVFNVVDRKWPRVEEALKIASREEPTGYISRGFGGSGAASLFGFSALYEYGRSYCRFPQVPNQ